MHGLSLILVFNSRESLKLQNLLRILEIVKLGKIVKIIPVFLNLVFNSCKENKIETIESYAVIIDVQRETILNFFTNSDILQIST